MKRIIIFVGILLFYSNVVSAQLNIPTNISLDYDTFVIPHPDSVKNIFKDFTGIETDRLLLRKVNEADANDILILASNHQVTKHTAALELIKTKEDALQLIHIMQKRYEENLPARWAIVYKPENKVIGICGFVGYSPSFCRAEIGYALSYDYWGKGIATEATKAVIELGFTQMKLNRIEATVDPDNIGSIHVIEKIGMKYEGMLRQHIWSKGSFKDRKMYALLKDEWLRK